MCHNGCYKGFYMGYEEWELDSLQLSLSTFSRHCWPCTVDGYGQAMLDSLDITGVDKQPQQDHNPAGGGNP